MLNFLCCATITITILPSSGTFVAAAMSNNGGPDHESETFNNFFDRWLVEQNQFLHELIDASKHRTDNTTSSGFNSSANEALLPLIKRVMQHYEHYYRDKSCWAKDDVLGMLSPSWRTQLEEAFLWIGGWRPSTAFHLLYSKSGLQLEARFSEVIRGLSTGDLADLSPDQFVRLDELQRRTIKEEKDITEGMAKQQETVADSSMVELSHEMTELSSQSSGGIEEEEEKEKQVDSTLLSKEEGLEEMLKKADDLRLRTFRQTVGLLKPMQAIHFLIAAAELHLRLHDWGKKREARHRHHAT